MTKNGLTRVWTRAITSGRTMDLLFTLPARRLIKLLKRGRQTLVVGTVGGETGKRVATMTPALEQTTCRTNSCEACSVRNSGQSFGSNINLLFVLRVIVELTLERVGRGNWWRKGSGLGW